jgi:inhibitor of cysteine peptidase
MNSTEVGEEDFGRARELEVGDELVIRLPENPTTGFRWHITSSGDGDLQTVDDSFEPGSVVALPGSAGHRVIRLVARTAGRVRLSLAHQRSWSPLDVTPQQLTITIGDPRSAGA